MENGFIKNQLEIYEQMFDDLTEKEKIDKVRQYFGYSSLSSIKKKEGREFLEQDAESFLLQRGIQDLVGGITLGIFIDELEIFYKKTETLGFYNWQKRISDWLDQKSHQHNEKLYSEDY